MMLPAFACELKLAAGKSRKEAAAIATCALLSGLIRFGVRAAKAG